MPGERSIVVDIGKGILIILVVFGHLESPLTKYIFWFHMPAFFIFSGMFLPSIKSDPLSWKSLIERGRKCFVPYISYFALISLVSFFLLPNEMVFDSHLFVRLFAGGRLLVGIYGAFWFVTCLFISQYLFFFIQSFRLPKGFIIFILAVLYFVELSVSKWVILKYIPLDADVSLIAVSYIFIGHFFKPIFIMEDKRWAFQKSLLIVALMLAFVFIDLYIWPDFFVLNMKYAIFNNIVLDMVIPVIFFIGIILLSESLSKNKRIAKALSILGRESLHIMYLHLLTIALLKRAGMQWPLVLLLLGTAVPVAFASLLQRHAITRFLFSGVKMSK